MLEHNKMILPSLPQNAQHDDINGEKEKAIQVRTDLHSTPGQTVERRSLLKKGREGEEDCQYRIIVGGAASLGWKAARLRARAASRVQRRGGAETEKARRGFGSRDWWRRPLPHRGREQNDEHPGQED